MSSPAANQRFPDDVDLLYEQAMMAEKIDRMDDMERLLRRVIELKPDHGHAHNALGYSLADRGLRLPEARELIQRALELRPGDPFITDSLGWVEFRLGNRDEAARLLRSAWAARPDTEIGAHLGEVLWAHRPTRRSAPHLAPGPGRDADNEVLRETLPGCRSASDAGAAAGAAGACAATLAGCASLVPPVAGRVGGRLSIQVAALGGAAARGLNAGFELRRRLPTPVSCA